MVLLFLLPPYLFPPTASLVAIFVSTGCSQQDSTMNKMAKQANLSDHAALSFSP